MVRDNPSPDSRYLRRLVLPAEVRTFLFVDAFVRSMSENPVNDVCSDMSKFTMNENEVHDFQPFRFLDLPKELRLMVYERLPRSIRPKTFNFEAEYYRDPVPTDMTVICRNIDTSILATCKQIHYEAKGIFRRVVTDFILSSPIRIVVRSEPGFDWQLDSLLEMIVRRAFRMRGADPRWLFTTDMDDISELLWMSDHSEKNGYWREAGKVRSSPLFVWVSQAAQQILHGSGQVHVAISTNMDPSPHCERIAMRDLVGLRTEMRRYVPTLRIQVLGFVRRSTSPDDLPRRHIGPRQDLWDQMDTPEFTAEEWAHDWFE